MTTIAPQSGLAGGRLDIGRVGQELFGLIQKDPVGTYGLAAGLAAIPAVLSLLLAALGVNTATGTTGPAALARLSAMGPWFLVTGLVGLVVGVLIYGALGWGAVEGLEGRAPTVGQKLSAAGAALLPTIGIAILAYIGIVIGCVLLLVPGLILATVWSVVIVAEVVDQRGVFGSFSRSAELTKNNRWMIFLLMVIYFVGAIVVGTLSLVFARIGVMAGPMGALVGSAVFQVLVGGALNAVGGVGVGVIYQQLRTLRGEFDAGRLNRVFS